MRAFYIKEQIIILSAIRTIKADLAILRRVSF